jgi:hypothetical protein
MDLYNKYMKIFYDRMNELYDIYKEDKARAIASGFCALFAFRPNDSVTRQYVQEQLGKNIVSETILANREPVVERRDGFAAEDWDLYALRTGEAFVALDAWPPFVFQFEKYEG